MYDKELQSFYSVPGRMMAKFLSKKWGLKMYNFFEKFLKGNSIKELDCYEIYIPSKSTEGHKIRTRIFRPKNVKSPLPAMLYIHGGGYMVGNPEQFFPTIKGFFDKRQFVMIAPDYRKSLKHPYPAGFNDCYETLLWMKENADQIGINADSFMIGGHSAGGGLTSAVTLKARDTNDVQIAFQMPIYPMLDHRQITESSKNMYKAPMWDSNNTSFGWDLYLKDIMAKGDPVSPYASPALNTKFEDLPPAISFVGDLEPFRDEVIAYMDGLKSAGIAVKFKLFNGAFHGFDMVAEKTAIAKKANEFQFEAFAEFFDKYIINKL